MKTLFMILIVILLSPIRSFAGWQTNFAVTYPYYFDEEIETTSPHYQAELSRDNFYLWASYEQFDLCPRHTSLGGVGLYGAGLGLRAAYKQADLLVQLGWYEPDAEAEGVWPWQNGAWEACSETQMIELDPMRIPGNVSDSPRRWKVHEYEIDGAIGGSVGAKTRLFDIGPLRATGIASYRFLKLRDRILGYNPKTRHIGYWATKHTRDLGALLLGVTVEYQF